jgi:hypothetical protein
MNNPLQQYFRQPKVYISLPSKGLFYEPGSLAGDYNNVPIFGMSGVDELLLKTPDALFNGDATVKVIESCCPFIKNASNIPSLDIDALLIGIKIATYGDLLTVSNTCKACGTENEYEISLGKMLEYFGTLTFNSQIKLDDNLTVSIRPLTYSEITYFSVEHFKLQKVLIQVPSLPEDERQSTLDNVYAQLSELQLQLYLQNIESIKLPNGAVVSEKQFIEEWLRNTERSIYKKIKDVLEDNRTKWNMPAHDATCANCGTSEKLSLVLDSSNFFV